MSIRGTLEKCWKEFYSIVLQEAKNNRRVIVYTYQDIDFHQQIHKYKEKVEMWLKCVGMTRRHCPSQIREYKNKQIQRKGKTVFEVCGDDSQAVPVTNSQIHKYANTQIQKYKNTKIQKYKEKVELCLKYVGMTRRHCPSRLGLSSCNTVHARV